MAKQQKLFNKFKSISMMVQDLGGIVQNGGFNPSEEQIKEFALSMSECINELKILRSSVEDFYKSK